MSRRSGPNAPGTSRAAPPGYDPMASPSWVSWVSCGLSFWAFWRVTFSRVLWGGFFGRAKCVSSSPAMSSTREAADKAHRLFDVRTIERSIKKGLITRKDYEKHLKALADATEKVAPPEEHPDDDAPEGRA